MGVRLGGIYDGGGTVVRSCASGYAVPTNWSTHRRWWYYAEGSKILV